MKRKFSPWMLIFLLFSFSATKSIAQKQTDWASMMQDPNSNVFTAKQNFDQYWQQLKPDEERFETDQIEGIEEESIEEPRNIFMRWFDFYAPRAYPTGKQTNPAIALYEHQKFLKNNPGAKGSANWTFLGPTHPGGYTQNGSYHSPGGSGRVNAIAFDPNNSNVIWIGTPAGGLWKTTDGGNTWTLMNDGLEVLGVSAIAIDPTNSNIIYIGTGDRDAGDTKSIGILKSTDGGATWNTTSVTFQASQGARCTDILINPDNPNIILASFNGIVYKTTDGFATKSTVLQKLIWDMEFKPGDPNTVYAVGTEFYKSTNGGSSFSQISSGLPTSGVQRMELAVSADEPNSVWLLAGRGSSYRYDFYGLYKSTNSGSSFYTLYDYTDGNLLGWDPNAGTASSGNEGGQSFYDLSLAVNPSNANEIFVGGVNLYKSTNGGSSWTCSAYWLQGAGYPYAHADYHAIEYQNSSTLFVGNDGGIFKSTDNGNSWTDISNNLAIAQVAKIGISATNPNLIMAGMQDNGTNKYDGSGWNIVYGGDGCEAICDPTDDNILYASYVQGKIYRSTNGGSSWSTITATSSESGAWITPYCMDPNSHTTLYAGYENVYKSTNSGYSWSRLGTAKGSGSMIELELAPSNTNYIYYIKQYWNGSTMSYTVGMTPNGGSSWYDIGSGLPLSSAAPNSIAVSYTDPQHVWVTFSGYSAGNKVFESTDGGQSWTNVSGNLPNVPVTAIVYQKGTDDGIYVGTDAGVYYKDNSMSDWQDFSTGLPNTIVRELEIYYDENNPANSRLRAATYGRSVWETPLATSPSSCGQPTNLAATNVTSTSAKLTWTGVSEAQSYDVRWKATSSSTWNTDNTTNTYLNISGLSTDDTQYEFQVRTNCSSGTSAYTASAYFGYTPLVYCDSKGDNSNDEYIGRFVMGTIDNNSGNNGGYGDFTNLSTDIDRGSNISFTIYPTWSGQKYDEAYGVFIDFNHDGDFDDAGETVFTKSPSQETTISGSFTVPNDAYIGETRMRVILRYNQVPSPCGTYNYGETEDYTVNIVNAGDQTPPTAPANLTASNVSNNSVDLSWDASTDNVGVTGYDVYQDGSVVKSVTSTSTTITGLSASTHYSFYVVAKDAAGNTSSESNVVEITTDADPDTQAPTAPSNLAYSNVTQISVDLSWDASSDNVGVTGYRIYKDDAFLASTSGTSYTVNGLNAGTTYEFYVCAYDDAGNISDPSNTVSVTTQSAGLSYCDSKGEVVSDEWIDRVKIGDIDNQSGANGGYADFTNLSTPLYRGNEATISIYPAWSSTKYDEAEAVWIDFNQDGDFDDSGELVYSANPSQNSPVVGTFTIPTSATLGETRMRVSMKYNALPTACETFKYGEVEDYTVDIQDAGDIDAPTAPSNLTYSNVTDQSVQLSWTASTDNVGVSGYKIYRNGSYLTSTTGTSYTVTGLSPATSYSFYVTAYDAAGNESDHSNTVNVTTENTPDTQAPTAPSNLTYSDVTSTSLNLAWDASTDNVGVDSYLIFQDGSQVGTTSNTYYTVSGLSPNTTYSFYVKAKDAAGNVSDASNTVSATTSNSTVDYCASNGQVVSDEWIGRVVFGSIDNNSGSNGGYADFTSLSTTVTKGTNQTITIYPAWSGTVYPEGEAVWIDFNQDGDFDDAGEQVVSLAASKNSPVSATFTIPADALTGSTRMRVSMKYNGIPTPCESFKYGEVEDYTVNITGSADTEAPTDPSNLSASNITQTTLTLCWDASTDNLGVDKYNIYRDGALYGYVDGNNTCANLSNLTPGATYQFYVTAVDASSNESGQSNTITVTMLPASTSYCDAQGNDVSYEWINRVVFNTIDKTSGANGGYADFTSISTNVAKGSSYTISIYPGFASSTYDEGYGVWIDFNQDGDFEDAGEHVYSHDKTTSSVSGTISIPTSASTGSTRMRVVMSYNATPSDPCATFSYGEVEDYTVNITTSKAFAQVANHTDFETISVYPNPATSVIDVNLPDEIDGFAQLMIYSADGTLVKQINITAQKSEIDVTEFAAGAYNIKIVNGDKIYNANFVKF